MLFYLWLLIATVSCDCKSYLLAPDTTFGTFHYEIPGTFAVSNGTIYPVLAHSFFRQVRNGSRTSIRGFIYFEQADYLRYWLGRLITQSQAVLDASPPSIALRGDPEGQFNTNPDTGSPTLANSSVVLDFNVSISPDTERPVHLELEAAVDDVTRTSWLTINDWPRAAVVMDLISRWSPDTSVDPAPTYWFVSFPLWGLRQDRQGYIIDVNIQWHVALGFKGLLLYAYSDVPYVEDVRVRPHLESGALKLVSWNYQDTGISRPFEAQKDRYDKSVLYNHAILSHWRTNTYLLIADSDEFLTFNVPTTIQQAHGSQGCMTNVTHQARLFRWDILCASCLEDNMAEIDVWDQVANVSILRQYTLMARQKDYYKTMVLPDAITSYSIHQGGRKAGYRHGYVKRDCAYMVHVKHLYRYRLDASGNIYKQNWTVDDDFVADTRWMWPLDNLHA